MSNKNKAEEEEKLSAFLLETENLKKAHIDSTSHSVSGKQSAGLSKPYQCPSCHKSLSSRKEPCKHCGYKGYIPMGDEEIKKTKVILFVIIFVLAITVYILTRK